LQRVIPGVYDVDISRRLPAKFLVNHARTGSTTKTADEQTSFSAGFPSFRVRRIMTKKQVALLSTVAAAPAWALVAFLGLGLTHMISDGSRVSIVMWVVWLLTMLSSLTMGCLPVFIMLWMKEPAMAGVAAGASAPAAAPGVAPDEDEAIEEDSEESFEDDESEPSGEKLFEDDALDDDFEDFEDFEDNKK
jgi:hypothetical protein